MVFSVIGIGGLAKRPFWLNTYDSLQSVFLFVVLHLIAFYFHYFFGKILEILYVVVAFCFLLLFCFLLIGFFLFCLFCYLGVRFFLVFWFFFFFWSLNMKILSNQTITFVKGCCCSCMINMLGGERFGCLTNSDTMEVVFFFFLNRKIVEEGGGGVQTMDIPNWSLLYWKEMIQIITSKFQSILFFFLLLILSGGAKILVQKGQN